MRTSTQSVEPIRFGDLPPITDALIALTDTRLVILGQPGVNAPPDRRLISQFRHVWCSSVTWDFTSRAFVQDLLQRIARNYLRLDLADPTGFVDSHTTKKQYLKNLASSPINPSEPSIRIPLATQ